MCVYTHICVYIYIYIYMCEGRACAAVRDPGRLDESPPAEPADAELARLKGDYHYYYYHYYY